MDLHDGRPFWPRRDGMLGVHPPLEGDRSCDVCVVGAGITGALVALELTRRGVDVVVVDRRDAGGGSTSSSTALLQYEIDELLVDLTDALGRDAAVAAYRECARGIDLVERATQAVGQTCGFRRSPSVFTAIRTSDVARLRTEFDARAAAGFHVTWLDADALLDRWGIVGCAAIESAEGASVDPYRLGAAALRTVLDRGGHVFDRTGAESYDIGPRRTKVITNRGVVSARFVIVAVGYEVTHLLPDLPLRLNSTFALVTEPISTLDRRYPDGLLFWDLDDPYLYGRTTDDRRLLVGGRDEPYRDPVRRHRALPSKTRSLLSTLTRRLPEFADAEVALQWSGTFAETPDGLAYIGGHSAFPRMFFALGFGGNGITYSALAAQYLADAVQLGGAPPEAALFDVERPIIRPATTRRPANATAT